MQYKVRIVETDNKGNPLKDKDGNPVITYEDYSLDDLMKIASGRDAINGFGLDAKNGMSPRQRLLSDEFGVYDEKGNRIDNDQFTNIVMNNFSKVSNDYKKDEEGIVRPTTTREEKPWYKYTLSDVAHGIASNIAGENPFKKQLKALKKQKEDLEEGTPEYKALEKKIAQTEVWSKDFDENILPETTKNNGFAFQKPVEAAGDFLDVIDAGTMFLPVGAAFKGLGLAGRGITKAGTGISGLMSYAGKRALKHPSVAKLVKKPSVQKGATSVGEKLGEVGSSLERTGEGVTNWVAKSPYGAVYDAAEQGLIEGVHGAIQADEGEGLDRGLTQGGVAAGIAGLTHGIGGKWLRQGEKLNEDIGKSLENLRSKGIKVPSFSPFTRKGQTALTPEELGTLRGGFIKEINRSPDLTKTITAKDLNELIRSVNDEMLNKEPLVPFKETRMFERGLKEGMLNSEWEKSVRDRLPAPSPDGTFMLSDIIPILFEKPIVTRKSRLGVPGVYDMGADADRSLIYKIGNWTESGKPQSFVTVGGDELSQEVKKNLQGIAGINPKNIQGNKITIYNEPWTEQLGTLSKIDELGKMKYDPNPLGVRSGKEGMLRSLLSPVVTMTEKRVLPIESWTDLVKRIESNAAMDIGRNAVVGPYNPDTWSWPSIQEDVKTEAEETKEKAKEKAKAGIKDLTGKARKEAVDIATEAAQNTLKGKRGK